MRLFIALDIDDAIRQRIQRFIEGVSGFAPDARWVRPESLHVTLKFIGEKPAESVEEIKRALSNVRAEPVEITFRGYGFFPTAKAARVFWVGIESGPQLTTLAKVVDEASFSLGIPKEDHPFSPHLTLRARRCDGPAGSESNTSSGCRRNWPHCPLLSLVPWRPTSFFFSRASFRQEVRVTRRSHASRLGSAGILPSLEWQERSITRRWETRL